jgi:hypothetical protein
MDPSEKDPAILDMYYPIGKMALLDAKPTTMQKYFIVSNIFKKMFAIFAKYDPSTIPTHENVNKIINGYIPLANKIRESNVIEVGDTETDYLLVYCRQPQYSSGFIGIRSNIDLIRFKTDKNYMYVHDICAEIFNTPGIDAVIWVPKGFNVYDDVRYLDPSEIRLENLYYAEKLYKQYNHIDREDIIDMLKEIYVNHS